MTNPVVEKKFDVKIISFIHRDVASDFAIASCQIIRHDNSAKIGNVIVCKGSWQMPEVGCTYSVSGRAEYNNARGEWQFLVEESIPLESFSAEGLISYIYRECPHIGKARARDIVSTFGEDTMRVMRENPEEVASRINGITSDSASDLQAWAMSEVENEEAKRILHSLQLPPFQIRAIISYFQGNVKRLYDECFDLVEVRGIGYKTVCKIANKIGIKDTDPRKIEATVIYSVNHLCQEGGHTCVPWDVLVSKVIDFLEVNGRQVVEVIKEMLKNGLICTVESDPLKHTTLKEIFNESQQ